MIGQVWEWMFSKLSQEFCSEVKQLQSHRSKNLSLSFYLLVVFRRAVKIFADWRQRAPEFSNALVSTLSNLELYLLPTNVITDVLGNVDHQEQDCELLSTLLHPKQIRYLLRQKKSYTGSELVYHIAKSKSEGSRCDSLGNREDVVKLCQDMLDKNVIKTEAVCTTLRNQLPQLVYVSIDDLLSEESKSVMSEDEGEASYDVMRWSMDDVSEEDERRFYDDDRHQYLFDQCPTDLTAFLFTRENGDSIQAEDLIAILKLKSNNRDPEAKTYLLRSQPSLSLFHTIVRRFAVRCL